MKMHVYKLKKQSSYFDGFEEKTLIPVVKRMPYPDPSIKNSFSSTDIIENFKVIFRTKEGHNLTLQQKGLIEKFEELFELVELTEEQIKLRENHVLFEAQEQFLLNNLEDINNMLLRLDLEMYNKKDRLKAALRKIRRTIEQLNEQ